MEQFMKKFYKKINSFEPMLSTILGALVIVVVSVLIFNYWKANLSKNENIPQVSLSESTELLPSNIHKVEIGENLWKISERYFQDGYKWVQIAKENNLANPDYIEVGQDLKIPNIGNLDKLDVNLETDQTLNEQSAQITNTISQDSYKVQQGDHLWSIAVRAYGDGYKWSEIAKTNKLINPDIIEIGQEISLPR